MSASPSYDMGQFHPEFGYFAPTIRFRSKVWLALKAVTLGVLAGAVAMFFLTMEREEKALTMLATPVTVAPVPQKPAQIAMPGQPPQTRVQQAQAPQTQAPQTQAQQAQAQQAQAQQAQAQQAQAQQAQAQPTQAQPTQAPQIQAPQTQAPRTQGPRPQAPATHTWAPLRFVPESMALPSAAPRTPEDMPPLRPTIATAPAPQPSSTVGASPAASEAAGAPPAAPVAKAAPKPKKKIVREPPPEPESRAAFASPPRLFGLPIFGFGWQR